MYVDLERLVEECKFSKRELFVLDSLMVGYSPADIGELLHVTRQSVEVFFKRAVSKIVSRNNERWHETYDKSPQVDGT